MEYFYIVLLIQAFCGYIFQYQHSVSFVNYEDYLHFNEKILLLKYKESQEFLRSDYEPFESFC